MCGITAVLSGEKEKSLLDISTFLRDAAIVTQLRGTDATGIYQVNGDVVLDSYKLPVSGSVFADLPQAQRLFLAGQSAYATVIHNRKATAGGVNYTTTHPFIHTTPEGIADFALVHNGTLTTWDRKKFESDSHQLAYDVFTEGNAAFETTSGAFACIYTNMQTEVTTVVSNGERDLYYAKVAGKDIVVMMSELGALSWVAARNGLKLENNAIYKVEKGFIYEFPFKSPTVFKKTKIELLTANSWNNYDTKNQGRNYGVARPPVVTPPAPATFPTTRSIMKGKMEELTAQMLGKTIAEKAVTTEKTDYLTIVKNDDLRINVETEVKLTPDEATAYQKLSHGVMSEEIMAVPIFWDEQNSTLTADVVQVHSKSKILLQDTVIVRGVSKLQGKAIMRFTNFPLIVVGVEQNNDRDVAMTFIAATPTSREFTKAAELRKAS